MDPSGQSSSSDGYGGQKRPIISSGDGADSQNDAETKEQKSLTDLQRRAAADLARRKVLETYTKSTKQPLPQTNPVPSATSQTHLKDAPVQASQINSESWKKYHTAWQNYYQKYYSEYYQNAAKQYVAKEKLKAERAAADDDLLAAVANSGNTGDATGLKLRVQKIAGQEKRKTRRFRKFIPLFAGVFVVLFILFLQYNRLIFAPIAAYVSPGDTPADEIEAIDATVTATVSSDPRLIIPKLNVDVPIQFGVALSEVMSAMNHGVAHYRIAGANAYPGQIGNFIITGHSAGDVYSSNEYKYIFSGLERLEEGDLIYVNYESIRYTYQVTKKEVIEPTNVQALVVQTDKPILTLVTCTPLGTSRYRLLVTAEQISPSYEGAEVASSNTDEDEVTVDESDELPSNEPSVFENIWNRLTGN